MAYDRIKAHKIWQTVQQVPEGRVSSYGLIADLAGLPGRARMVGKVMQFAPTEMKLPWYRIVKSNGQLAFSHGTKSARLQTEQLRLEGVEVQNNRVNLGKFGWKPELGDLLQMKF